MDSCRFHAKGEARNWSDRSVGYRQLSPHDQLGFLAVEVLGPLDPFSAPVPAVRKGLVEPHAALAPHLTAVVIESGGPRASN
jgi:hypothetical protein